MALNDLKSEPMMAHLISTLASGHSIGHYGRLVFTMVARHFIEPEELIALLENDPECDRPLAEALFRQVESRNYNPPKRERVLDWMRRQEFPICPDPANPSECNVYRNLNFPREVYDRIAEFYTAADAA
ncbi:MAG: hypothetical protein JO336_04065 [Acidobacteriia bacterium]|nr:hypothetical protein [Terriglobia bacterium]MBV8903580.1 hypothetical protein [Terriglobia bacterium]